MSVIYIRR